MTPPRKKVCTTMAIELDKYLTEREARVGALIHKYRAKVKRFQGMEPSHWWRVPQNHLRKYEKEMLMLSELRKRSLS